MNIFIIDSLGSNRLEINKCRLLNNSSFKCNFSLYFIHDNRWSSNNNNLISIIVSSLFFWSGVNTHCRFLTDNFNIDNHWFLSRSSNQSDNFVLSAVSSHFNVNFLIIFIDLFFNCNDLLDRNSKFFWCFNNFSVFFTHLRILNRINSDNGKLRSKDNFHWFSFKINNTDSLIFRIITNFNCLSLGLLNSRNSNYTVATFNNWWNDLNVVNCSPISWYL